MTENNSMKQEEIKNFLKNKRGYLKKGSKALKEILLKRGYLCTVADCKSALKETKQELKNNILDNHVDFLDEKTDNLKVLIYDIETSYNIVKSWRVGYNLNINPQDIIHERSIICVSYKWLDDDQIYTLTWDKNQNDKFLLEQFIEVMNEADLLVAHNGDRYDLKFIKTRALKQDLPMLIDYPQFDTLKVAKKKFMFNSNKLDYIAEFLGFGNKIKTELKLWDDIILHNSKEAMNKMIEYCEMDVELLEKVYKKLVNWEKPKLHLGVLRGKDKITSPITGGLNIQHVKEVSTGKGTIKHIMKDLDTNRLFEMSHTNYKKFLNQ